MNCWIKLLYVLLIHNSITIAIAGQHQTANPSKLLAEIGKAIYLTGYLPSGEPIKALVGGDAEVSGDQFSCVSCHRRSRLGTSEGGKQVPSLTATALFNPVDVSTTKGVLPKAFKQNANAHAPYTDESLAKAIRDGVDPSGKKLSPLMPRYTLTDDALGALITYLKTQPSTHSAGVDETNLHFATVVTEDVEPKKSKLMLQILQTYFQDKNADTRHNTKRAKFSAYKMYQVYRKWQLHTWVLTGKPESWPQQLTDYYKKQPVLAMVGGISRLSWKPIHSFCEQQEIACLFPNTNLPVIAESDFFTAYFSAGLTLEAKALAKYINNTASATKSQTHKITQIYRDNSAGQYAANAFKSTLQNTSSFTVEGIMLPANQKIDAAFLQNSFNKLTTTSITLWLSKQDFDDLTHIKSLPDSITVIYSSASLLEGVPSTSTIAGKKILFTYPWDLPNTANAQLMRIKSWLSAKKISYAEDEGFLQANTFFAAQILGEVISHLLDNFSATYIMERVEGMLANFGASSVYPHISSGVNQRFAVKGCYIIGVEPDGRLIPTGGWIIP